MAETVVLAASSAPSEENINKAELGLSVFDFGDLDAQSPTTNSPISFDDLTSMVKPLENENADETDLESTDLSWSQESDNSWSEIEFRLRIEQEVANLTVNEHSKEKTTPSPVNKCSTTALMEQEMKEICAEFDKHTASWGWKERSLFNEDTINFIKVYAEGCRNHKSVPPSLSMPALLRPDAYSKEAFGVFEAFAHCTLLWSHDQKCAIRAALIAFIRSYQRLMQRPNRKQRRVKGRQPWSVSCSGTCTGNSSGTTSPTHASDNNTSSAGSVINEDVSDTSSSAISSKDTGLSKSNSQSSFGEETFNLAPGTKVIRSTSSNQPFNGGSSPAQNLDFNLKNIVESLVKLAAKEATTAPNSVISGTGSAHSAAGSHAGSTTASSSGAGRIAMTSSTTSSTSTKISGKQQILGLVPQRPVYQAPAPKVQNFKQDNIQEGCNALAAQMLSVLYGGAVQQQPVYNYPTNNLSGPNVYGIQQHTYQNVAHGYIAPNASYGNSRQYPNYGAHQQSRQYRNQGYRNNY